MNDLIGRLENTQNQNQGTFPKVLCLCSAGLLRSPTLAWVLSNEPWSCNTRAAGVVPHFALIVVDPVLIRWADVIVCANDEVLQILKAHHLPKDGPDAEKPVVELDIPDRYQTRHPELIKVIGERLLAVDFAKTLSAFK